MDDLFCSEIIFKRNEAIDMDMKQSHYGIPALADDSLGFLPYY